MHTDCLVRHSDPLVFFLRGRLQLSLGKPGVHRLAASQTLVSKHAVLRGEDSVSSKRFISYYFSHVGM
jgi:hypothetical protein